MYVCCECVSWCVGLRVTYFVPRICLSVSWFVGVNACVRLDLCVTNVHVCRSH